MSVMLREPATVNATNYKLLPAKKYYTTRQKKVKGAVVHVTAGLQDLGMVGTDESAEGTNKWALTQLPEVSWHRIADSDGVESCLPSWYTAWQAKGYNSTTVGVEISNVDARWDNKPSQWVKWTIWHAARAFADYAVKYKIPLRRATKAELDHAIATDGAPVGFVDHSRLSTNRVDPGATFPWDMFFRFMRAIIAGALDPDHLTPPAPPTTVASHKEASMQFYQIDSDNPAVKNPVIASDGFQMRWLNPNGWRAIRDSIKQQTGVTPVGVPVQSLDGVAVVWVGPKPFPTYPIPSSVKVL